MYTSYFTSPESNIPSISTTMSSSNSSAMDIRPRSSSSYSSWMTRSNSSGGFSTWPYRSCLNATSADEPTSYLSDDDLLPSTSSSSSSSSSEDVDDPVLLSLADKELSTEEQIARLRAQAEESDRKQRQLMEDRRPTVWWQQEQLRQDRKKERKVSFPGEKKRSPGMGKRSKSSKSRVVQVKDL